jgi:hypothetical protein
MSFSKPFFNTAPTKYRPNVPKYDKAEHWSKTVDRRPVGQKYGKGYPPNSVQVDYDNRIDNVDDPEGEQ